MINYTKLESKLNPIKQARVGLGELIGRLKEIDAQLGEVETEIFRNLAMARMGNQPEPKNEGPFASDGFRSPFGMFPERQAGEPEQETPQGKPKPKGKPLADLLGKAYHRINPG